MALASYCWTALFYLTALAIAQLTWILWKAFTGPLRSIPGPWHTNLTNWRLKWAVLTGQRIFYIHFLHEKYGPIVRIALEEVAVSDLPSHKAIYRMGSGFVKSDWYNAFAENKSNVRAIFNMVDPKEHSERRRLLSVGFNQRLMREHWESTVKERASMAVAQIKNEATSSGTADILKWWTLMSADVTSSVLWGKSFGMLELGYKVPLMDALEQALIQMMLTWELPMLFAVLRWLQLPALRKLMSATDRLRDQGSKAVQECKSRGVTPNTLFSALISDSEKEGSRLSDESLRVEAGNLIVAGSDTTSNTLTYLTWAILKNPDARREVLKELDDIGNFTDATLEALPVLNATIEESLRLYGSAPSTLPRVAPPGGITLHGHYIPEKMTVGTQVYTMHRDPAVYPEPMRYDYTRFLPSSPLYDAAKQTLEPFGYGATNCLGVHLARMELRLATAIFFTELRSAKLAPETTDKSMEMENYFTITPKTHRCNVCL